MGSDYAIEYEGKIEKLPQIKSTGLALRVRTAPEIFTVFINESGVSDVTSHHLLVIADGQLLWKQTLENKIIKLDKKTIPTGLVTIAIVDSDNKPVTERLVFNHYGIDDVFWDIGGSDKAFFSSRSLVEIPIEFYDADGESVSARLSASVVDHRYHYERPGIMSHWLLKTEIKGHVENPEQYLSDNSKETIEKTDLLLLTQGWRRYNWSKTEGILFPKEKNLSISGRTVKPKTVDEGIKTYGSMSILDEEFKLVPFETDVDGYFFIDDVSLVDSISLMFQVGTKKPKDEQKVGGKPRGNTKIDVILDKPLQHDVVKDDLDMKFIYGGEKKKSTPTYEVEEVAPEEEWYVDESLLLDEVTIKEKKFDKWIDYYDDVTPYKDPDTRVFTDNGGAIESYTDCLLYTSPSPRD